MRIKPHEPGPPLSEAFDGAIDRSTRAQTLNRGLHLDASIGACDALDSGYGVVGAAPIADHNKGLAAAAVRLEGGNDTFDISLFVQAGNHDQNVGARCGLRSIDRRGFSSLGPSPQPDVPFVEGRYRPSTLSNYVRFSSTWECAWR